MIRARCALFCFLAGIALLPIDASSRSFRFHTVDDELPSLSISSITQDSQGFMWYGTQGGLVFYNGVSYQTLTSVPFAENTLSSNLVQTMIRDGDNILWIGTYAGLDRYDIKTGLFTHYSVGGDVVVSLLKDSSGRIWAGTLDGLGCLIPGTGSIKVYRKSGSAYRIPDNTVRNLFQDENGTIYASTYNGLYEYNEFADRFVPAEILAPGNPARDGVIYGVQQDSAGFYWIAKWGVGMIRVDPTTHEFTVFPLADNRIYCMNTSFDQSLVLAGTWGGGLNVLDKKTGEITVYSRGSRTDTRISSDVIYSMYVDTNGLLWVGTNGGGVSVHDPEHSWFSSVDADFESDDNLPGGKVNALLADPDGSLWISVTNKGLCRFDPETRSFTHFRADPGKKGSLPSDMIFCLFRDSRGTLYIGTDQGLVRYYPESGTFAFVDWFAALGFAPAQRLVSCMNEGPDGSWWVGTFDHGVIRYFPQTGIYRRYENREGDETSLSNNMVYFIQYDSRENVWIGTNKGLNRTDDRSGGVTRFLYDRTNPQGISGNTMYAFLEQSDGRIWFGTRNGGLCFYDPVLNRFSHYSSKDGLPSDTIVALAPSRGNLIWAATQNGLVQFDTISGGMFVYKTSDGLLSQMFNTAIAVSADGTRYFGTPLGLVYFAEDDVSGESGQIPEVALTELTVNNTRVPIPYDPAKNRTIVLKPDQKNIAIGYTALDFSPISRYSFSYRLEGFDNGWTMAGERRLAMYTNLNPGTYRFRVRIVTPESGGVGGETLFTIRIENPRYLRWYALIGYAALLAIILNIAWRIRRTVVLERKVGELEAAATSLQSVNSRLETLSYQDPLTGIANRRYFEYVIMREWDAALIREDFLTVLMIDIDFFKRFNDTFGHQSGDEALKKVALSVKSSLFRISDVAARYGGEEFVVILPDTNREHAMMVCERIMAGVRNCHIEFSSGISEELTISIGCFTGIPAADLTFEKFVKRADEALYRAKRTGRNRTCIYTPSDDGL